MTRYTKKTVRSCPIKDHKGHIYSVEVKAPLKTWDEWRTFYFGLTGSDNRNIQHVLCMRRAYDVYIRSAWLDYPNTCAELFRNAPTVGQLRHEVNLLTFGPYNYGNYSSMAELAFNLEDEQQKGTIPMNACILKVAYTANYTRKYSFFAPKDFNIEATPYVVVPNAGVEVLSKHSDPEAMRVVRVIEKIDVVDDTYNGSTKWIVAAVSIDDYTNRIARERRKTKLLAQVKERVERRNTIDQYRKLAEGDEEALKMLAEIEELEKE